MPSGRTHDRITLCTLPLTAALSLTVTWDAALTLAACGGFLFSGLMLGPDLDVRSLHFKRWGWFRWIWVPYRGSLKHRSPLSHGPITGTVLRVVYLLCWLALAWFVSLTMINEVGQLGWTWGDILGRMGRTLQAHRALWLALVVGLELGAFSHYMADWGVSAYKRVQKKGWRSLFVPQKKSRKGKRRKSRSR
jgi:uncharacterized metal-binding protein